MKLHKDYYEYKTIPFTYFAKIKNRHDFKREWVTVRCQEDILKQQPQNNLLEVWQGVALQSKHLGKLFDKTLDFPEAAVDSRPNHQFRTHCSADGDCLNAKASGMHSLQCCKTLL